MEKSDVKRPSYIGRALSGEFAPELPQSEAFIALERILGDMMDISAATNNMTIFLFDQLDLSPELLNEGRELTRQQINSMTTLLDSLRSIIERAKEVERGRD